MIIVIAKKKFGEFTLDVSLRFAREFVALTGRNGSGKTTLLRVIAGLERPQAGRIVVMGRTFFDGKLSVPCEKRRVGYLFQDPALFPWLTVGQNARFGLKGVDESTLRESIGPWLSELYEEFHIRPLLDRMPESLSGGEAQRVALVRALAPCPDMLLLDEPFSAVDMDMRPSLRRFVSALQRRWNIPVLMVSHDHGEIHTMADRVFTLKEGKVEASTKRAEFSEMPRISY